MRTCNGISVYYPFVLVDLLAYIEAEDHDEGEALLTCIDCDGATVSVRLSPELARAICERLNRPPDPRPGDA